MGLPPSATSQEDLHPTARTGPLAIVLPDLLQRWWDACAHDRSSMLARDS